MVSYAHVPGVVDVSGGGNSREVTWRAAAVVDDDEDEAIMAIRRVFFKTPEWE